ncbi:MAG: hypothetical protein IT238_02900 [Bacteroidia bacterium]|nr:hypothetical protein [Bacteroidia bacterium]
MLKTKNILALVFMLIIIGTSCKPVQKSYLPYRKKNKCGCPTYSYWHNRGNIIVNSQI